MRLQKITGRTGFKAPLCAVSVGLYQQLCRLSHNTATLGFFFLRRLAAPVSPHAHARTHRGREREGRERLVNKTVALSDFLRKSFKIRQLANTSQQSEVRKALLFCYHNAFFPRIFLMHQKLSFWPHNKLVKWRKVIY